MQHFMLDTETLGTTPNSIILQVAAVEFDIHSAANSLSKNKRWTGGRSKTLKYSDR